MTVPGREYTDDALLQQLAGFMSYQQRGGHLSLVQWMDSREFTEPQRTMLEVAWMGATVEPYRVRC